MAMMTAMRENSRFQSTDFGGDQEKTAVKKEGA